MKRETASDAMSRKALEFEALIAELRSKFYDLPAPDSDGLDWGHVGDAARITESLADILN